MNPWIFINLTYFCFFTNYLTVIIDLKYFIGKIFGLRGFVSLYSNHVFLKKHLIKKRNPINILYLGLKCNNNRPRISYYAYSTLLLFVLTLTLSIFAIIYYSVNCDFNLSIVGIVFFASSIFVVLINQLIVEVESKKTKKQENELNQEDFDNIRSDIEKEWPGFFKNR